MKMEILYSNCTELLYHSDSLVKFIVSKYYTAKKIDDLHVQIQRRAGRDRQSPYSPLLFGTYDDITAFQIQQNVKHTLRNEI